MCTIIIEAQGLGKLLKKGYVGDYIEDYHRGYSGGYWEFKLQLNMSFA